MKSKITSLSSVVTSLLFAVLAAGVITTASAANAADLTFQGDSSFQGPHGGQDIHVAVVESDSGKVVAKQSGTVSKTSDPAFSFTFKNVLMQGKAYEVHYWIDSNFGGGTAGACDPKAQDHQWNVSLGMVEGAVTHTESHRPAETTDVCKTFME